MNVGRAIDIFREEIIAAVACLKENSYPLNSGRDFEDSGSTLNYMKTIKKWFSIHNVSNRTHSIHSKNLDHAHFFKIDDERLLWLENGFPAYLDKLKGHSCDNDKRFLRNDTYGTVPLTTQSTVLCTRYLLESGFHFVLTRLFNSDKIELFFGGIRNMCAMLVQLRLQLIKY